MFARPAVLRAAAALACALAAAYLIWRGLWLMPAIVLAVAAAPLLWRRLWPFFLALWLY